VPGEDPVSVPLCAPQNGTERSPLQWDAGQALWIRSSWRQKTRSLSRRQSAEQLKWQSVKNLIYLATFFKKTNRETN